MNNNTNPNKRRANFNTQQRRGAKRQKLNPRGKPPIMTRGRGRGPIQRGRGHPRLKLVRRGGSHIRGRGSYRGRGRGSHTNPNQQITRTINTTNTNTSATPLNLPPPQTSVASLRAKLLANQKAKASVSPQRPVTPKYTTNPLVVPGATTPDQIENQQRKKRLVAQRQIQKAATATATHAQSGDALKALRAQALKSMKSMDKKKTNPTPPNARRRLTKASPAQQLNPNTIASKPIAHVSPDKTHNIPRRQLKSYRQGPKTKDNISFTTTVFDTNHNAVRTTISTNQISPNKVIKPNKPMPPKLTNIPPKIVLDTIVKKESQTVAVKQAEPKPQVVPQVEVYLPNNALNWACQICTFHNKGNQSMKCNMCKKTNTKKKAISVKKKKTQSTNKKQIQTIVQKTIPKKTLKPEVTRPVSLSQQVMSMEAVWKQRERAIKEMEAPKKNDSGNIKPKSTPIKAPVFGKKTPTKSVIPPVVNDDKQSKKAVTETVQNVEMKTSVAVVKEIKKAKPPPEAVYVLPSMKECWKWDVKKKISDASLKGFLQETDVFVKGMNVNLKVECKASGIEYRNPFDAENDYLMLNVVEDFEWTKKICNQNGVIWPDGLDMNSFSKVITRCNDW